MEQPNIGITTVNANGITNKLNLLLAEADTI
jgi:hypothetical protein